MAPLKYRQAIFVNGEFLKWHYWGFIGEGKNVTFVAPETNLSSIEEAYRNSYQCTERKDKDNNEIYKGDILQSYPTQDIRFVVGHGKNSDDDGIGFTLISTRRNKIYAFDTSVIGMKLIGNIVEDPELMEEVK